LARLVTLFGEIEVAMAKPIGKLKKMNLDEVWGNEPDGFAGWLQQEDILDMLGETIEVTHQTGGTGDPFGHVGRGRAGERRKAWNLYHRFRGFGRDHAGYSGESW
jgi:hypothetical protein